MTSDRTPLADVLEHFMRIRGWGFEVLASKSGVHRNTVYRWLHADVRKTHSWQPLAQVANALELSKSEANKLLQAAQHPSVDELLDRVRNDEDRALLSRWAVSVPNNLPGHLTSFIGREEEIASVIESLSSARLVTLTGPGGSGKTRLALEAARAVLDDFPEGVYLVELAPITDPALVLPAISRVLGTREAVDEPPIEVLKAYLRDRRMLLLLDNFEQVVEAAPLVVELLAAAPKMKVLVTSRTRLHVRGEHEMPVPPLALPSVDSPFEELRAYPAVALFADRARAVRPDFALTEESAPLVAEICARLDGLPLAIELAAARTRRFGLRTMLARFPSRLDLGDANTRDAPSRQRTLRSTISWSYDLLSPNERRLFRLLAVFAGGCPEEAVESVCNLDRDPEIDVTAVLDSLVENNLLRQTSGVDEEPRYEMLETIREYALERLEESGELEGAQRAHAGYYLGLARTAEPEFDGPARTYWLDRLEQEHDNFRAALGWYRERGEVVRGLRLSTILMALWQLRDHHLEGRRWLQTFLADGREVPPDLRAKALLWQGTLSMRYAGDFVSAAPLFCQALSLYKEIGDLSKASETLQAQGDAALNKGYVSTASALYEESLNMALEGGDAYMTSRAYLKIAVCAQEGDDFEEAERCWGQVLKWTRIAGNKVRIAQALNGLGEMARHRRDLEGAQVYYQQCLELASEINSDWCTAVALHNLGYVACYRGEHERAFELFTESLSLYARRLNKKGIGECLAGMAKVAASEGEMERAARLCGASEAPLESIGARLDTLDRADYEQTVSLARCKLGDERFEVLRAEGRMMSPEWAVEYALHR